MFTHTNYAWCLSVYVQGLSECETAITVHEEFKRGKFRYPKIYSAILFRPMNKKKNVVFNGDRGAVGLKEDPGALRWWVVEAAGV